MVKGIIKFCRCQAVYHIRKYIQIPQNKSLQCPPEIQKEIPLVSTQRIPKESLQKYSIQIAIRNGHKKFITNN
jgi:hypothetical protein